MRVFRLIMMLTAGVVGLGLQACRKFQTAFDQAAPLVLAMAGWSLNIYKTHLPQTVVHFIWSLCFD